MMAFGNTAFLNRLFSLLSVSLLLHFYLSFFVCVYGFSPFSLIRNSAFDSTRFFRHRTSQLLLVPSTSLQICAPKIEEGAASPPYRTPGTTAQVLLCDRPRCDSYNCLFSVFGEREWGRRLFIQRLNFFVFHSLLTWVDKTSIQLHNPDTCEFHTHNILVDNVARGQPSMLIWGW